MPVGNRMQRMRSKMNNKIRYKSMKRSSPLAQYKRMLLGKHYRNEKGFSRLVIPKAMQKHIEEQWKEFQRIWSHAEVHVIRKGMAVE